MFDSWNLIKKERDALLPPAFFRVREIWFCAVGINIGFEQDGKHQNFERPVLILKKLDQHLFFGVPLTSRQPKRLNDYGIKFLGRQSTVILPQLRVYDSRRLLRKIYRLPRHNFQSICQWYINCFK